MPARRKESATVDIKIRMKEPLRAAVERAAKRRGVSMNAEMVERLERGFEDDEQLPRALKAIYGPTLAGIVLVMVRAMAGAGHGAGTLKGAAQWTAEPYAYDQAMAAAAAVLEAFRPAGQSEPPAGLSGKIGDLDIGAVAANFGRGHAAALLSAIAGQTISRDLELWASEIRPLLGPLAEPKPASSTEEPTP